MGNYASVVLADKPIRYYRLNESSGTTALDQVSSTNNGTLHGGVTLNQAGLLTADPIDASMLFNGSSGYISLPTSGLPTGAHAFTLECWLKLTGSPPAGSNTFLWLGTNVNLQGITPFWYQPDGNLYVYYGTSVKAQNIVLNDIYHSVTTYDGSTLCLYVNGIQLATQGSLTLNLTYGAADIGVDTGGNYASSYINNVAIYNTALSASQVNNHYLAGIGSLNFPVVPVTTTTRDGRVTLTARDGRSISTKTRD